MNAANASRGVITIATGKRRYIDMAIALARSLERHSPGLARAVVTDSDDPLLASLYEERIAVDPSRGAANFGQRFHVDSYTPYDETLMIDADSLVVEDIGWTFDLFEDLPFGVIGRQLRSGFWYGDVAEILSRIDRPELPQFNGGFYYFDRSERARRILETARELAERYDELGLPAWRGGMSDEPVFSMALSLHGIRAVDDRGRVMRTPIGIRGWLHIDVLGGRCAFNKAGSRVRPAVAHFADVFAAQRDPRGAFYRREADKLSRASGERRANPLASARHALACALGCIAMNLMSLRIAAGPRLRSLRERVVGRR